MFSTIYDQEQYDSKTSKAKCYLTHYLQVARGCTLAVEEQQEIGELVDSIIEAAVEETVKRLGKEEPPKTKPKPKRTLRLFIMVHHIKEILQSKYPMTLNVAGKDVIFDPGKDEKGCFINERNVGTRNNAVDAYIQIVRKHVDEIVMD